MRFANRPWVVVLAGGSGERLLPMTAEKFGRPVPKQFCRLDGRESMLGITIARARGLTESARIVVAVLEAHRKWWEEELAGIDSENVIRQSRNRGTGYALYVALLHIQARDPDATVVVLPSDHMVDDEGVLRRTIREAVDAVRDDCRCAVLLGARARGADSSVGWIRPGPAEAGRVHAVLEFVEKPASPKIGMGLRGGWYVNTMILTAGLPTLLEIYEQVLPARWLMSWPDEEKSVDVRHRASPRVDLSGDLLPLVTERLRVLPLPDCGWTDVGTIERLNAWWADHPSALEEVHRWGGA